MEGKVQHQVTLSVFNYCHCHHNIRFEVVQHIKPPIRHLTAALQQFWLNRILFFIVAQKTSSD